MPAVDAVDATVRDHLPLVGWLACRYLRTHDVPPSVTRDDLRRAGGEAVWRAASRWQPDRARLATFARPKILSNFRDVVARAGRPCPAACGAMKGFADPRSEDAVKRIDDADAFDALTHSLSPKHRAAVTLYYRDGLSLGEVGRAMGFGESNVSRVLRDAREAIRKSLPA